MSKEQKNVPKLRFPEFTGEWERKRLGDIASSFDYGLNAAAKEYDGQNRYIRITDINDETHEFMQRDVTSPDTDLSLADNYLLKEGDLLFARTGASVGKSYLYKNEDGLVYFAGFLIRACIKKEYNPSFVFQNTLTTKYKEYISITSQRSGQPGVNAQEYSRYMLMIPEKKEQDQIAEIFQCLDTLITLQQRKLDQIKEYKKGMLQKMFPKEGETVPEVRFPGFTGDWVQRKLGECMEAVTDYVAAGSFADIASNVEYKNSPDFAQLVRTVDLKHNFNNTGFVYVDKKAFDYLWRVNLDFKCIIIPNIGANIGEVYYVEPSHLPYENNVLGPNAILLKPKDSALFIYTLLQAGDFQHKLSISIASSGQPKFNKTELKNIMIAVPSKEEQNHIGHFFSSLDTLISLQQRKLDAMKEYKKGLLQQMFV